MTSFQPILTSNLFQVPPSSPGGAWCAYMLGAGDANPGQAISLDDALNTYHGSFLFAPALPQFAAAQDANDLIAAVWNWLGNQGTARFCVWLPSAQPLTFGSKSFSDPNGTSFAFRVDPQSSGLALAQTFNAMIGINASLAVSQGAVLVAEGDNLAIKAFSQPGIFFNFQTGMAPQVEPNHAALPLAGPYAGCLVVAGQMSASATLAGMGAGMLFAIGDGSGPDASDVVQQFPLIDPQGGNAATPFPMVAAIDPLDPFCTGPASNPVGGVLRTLLTAQGGGTVTIPSLLRTVTNQAVGLVPLGGGDPASGPAVRAGGFVFQPVTPMAKLASGLPQITNVMLAPAGDFALSVDGGSVRNALLCGLSGTETMQFQPSGAADADTMRFLPCQPAYTPQYPFPVADLENPSTGVVTAPLPASPQTYITAWAMLVAGGDQAPAYNAQPQGSNLFGPGGANGDATMLGALDSTVPLTWTPGFAVPLVPWAGMGSGSALPSCQWQSYDAQVLSATRRNAVLGAVRPQLRSLKQGRRAPRHADTALMAVGPGRLEPNGTTPQGLLAQTATVAGITDYEAVVLAQSDAGGGPASQMAFFNLTSELQALFQTNQLFAVITDPTHLGTLLNGQPPDDPTAPAFANQVNIAGWTMQAAVGSAAGSSTVRDVMILKFCAGALSDLITRSSAWVDPVHFSSADSTGSVCALSQAVQNYIEAAVEMANGGNTLYANFVSIVTNPDWQGILVLGAEVSPSDLPPQLAGLAAGIDFSRFVAHHFGVTVSQISATGGVLSIPGASSYFGLIDYMLPAYAQNLAAGAKPTLPLALPGNAPYNFTVLQLQALFRNSALVDFRSHVQLTVNQLFGSTVTATYGTFGQQAANGIVLTGTYQSQGGTGTYLFESDSPTVFVPDSNVLDTVVFTKVMFNTLTANDGGTPPNILSRLLIWGSLDFAVLHKTDDSPYDILSYGMPAGTQPSAATGGLAFSNLQIRMASPVASPNVVTYSVNETSIAFDQAASLLRPDGLVPGLSLQPDCFVVSDGGKTPANVGFLPMTLGQDGPPQTMLSGPWYGVSLLINMGGPGALAAAAGFTSHLLLAWSPQSKRRDTTTAVFVGLQLPGASPGASCFSVQGVLNLTVQTIALSYAPVAGGGGNAFTLKLGNIALKFLGIAKLPPGATIDMFLFGAPGSAGSPGWYAAYVEDQSKQTATALLPEARP